MVAALPSLSQKTSKALGLLNDRLLEFAKFSDIVICYT
jgi:hypothetical protein